MARVKHITFIAILVILFLPLVQQYFSVFRIKPLKGSYSLAEEPVFSFHDYFAGAYQSKFDTWLEQHIGFRPLLVRINNQIAFSFFRMALASDVIIGKKNYLYELNYIKAFLGRDFQGAANWERYVEKLKTVSDSLDKRGTHLIVVFAPGKGTFFPEYIPGKYQPWDKDTTNQGYLVKKFQENGIRYIDVNHWFTVMKDRSPYPLYPKTGIHWSNYGEALFLDSLIRYMESFEGKKMVDFGWDEVTVSNDLQSPDDDIGEGMNLLFGISHPSMPYPKFYFKEGTATFKPSVITVADSYYWNLFGRGITQRIYTEDKFWYYFKSAHGKKYTENQMVDQLDVLTEIIDADFVVLLSTDANLHRFDFGFSEKVYDLIKDKQLQLSEDFNQRMMRMEQIIRNSPQWMEIIRQKALKRNLSIDEMVRIDARWMIENNKDMPRSDD
jgi:hypothetical protein